jgi:hypothetical protein
MLSRKLEEQELEAPKTKRKTLIHMNKMNDYQINVLEL